MHEELVVEVSDGLEDLLDLIGQSDVLWSFIGVDAVEEVLVLVGFLSELAVIEGLGDGWRQGEGFCGFGHLEDDGRKGVFIDFFGEEGVVAGSLGEEGGTSALLS